jgi:hypothetical protein
MPDAGSYLDDTGEYSRTKRYTRASNSFDHASRKQIAFPRGMLATAAELVESRIWPEYRTVEDVIRDGLFHVIVERAEQMEQSKKQGIMRGLNEEAVIASQEQAEAMIRNREQLLAGAEKLFIQLHRIEDWTMLGEQLDGHRLVLMELPEPWATKLQDLIGEFDQKMGKRT